MSVREVFSCDHCGEALVQKYTITAFGYDRHLCQLHAGQLEMWIKPKMAENHGCKVEIVISKEQP